MFGKSAQKPFGKSARSEEEFVEHYSRIPDSALHDHALSFSARCVYCEIAGHVRQGTISTIGMRLIAKRLGCHIGTVKEAVHELATRKHIEIRKRGKQRFYYHLTSSVFGQKQRAGVYETDESPSGGRRAVSAPSDSRYFS